MKKKEKEMFDEKELMEIKEETEDCEVEMEDDFDEKEAEEFEREVEEEIEKDKGKSPKEQELMLGPSVNMFMQEMKQFDMLTPAQEKELTKLAKVAKRQCDRDKAKERLQLCNWRLVVYAAKKFQNLGVDLDDLIMQGMIGLKTGIDKFDYKAKTRLSTYVLYWIKQAMSRYIADNGRMIRLPVHINDKLSKYNKAKRELRKDLMREPTTKEVAKKLKVKEADLEELLQSSQQTISLEKEIDDDDGDSTVLGDLIADPNAISPEANTESLMLIEKVHDAVSTLKDKEKQVIELRFGLANEKSMTLEEVGELMGITRERVRQIQEIAIKKLKVKLQEFEEFAA